MPQSSIVDPACISKVELALKGKGFSSRRGLQKFLKKDIYSHDTVNKFFRSEPIKHEYFVVICDALGLDWQKIIYIEMKPYELEIPGFDDLLRAKSDELFTQIIAIRKKVFPILRRIPITPYSHDSVNHAVETINLMYKLFNDALNQLTAEELFVTGVFCLIHDIGMRAREDLSPKQLYDSHNSDSCKYAKSLEINYSKEIAELCLVHNKCLDEAEVYLKKVENDDLRLTTIFSMFRVSDMLEVEIQPGEEILRINKKFLERSIANIDIKPSLKTIFIKRNFGTNEQQFQDWLSYFNLRLDEYNQVLAKIDHAYRVEANL